MYALEWLKFIAREAIPEVLESLAIGQSVGDDVRVVLFVVLREGLELDDELRQQIKMYIRNNTTPRHVPEVIAQVPDLPRTVSGKIANWPCVMLSTETLSKTLRR